MNERERERDEPVLLRETSFTIKTFNAYVYIYFDTHKKKHTRILLLKSNRLSLLLKLKFEFNEYRRVFRESARCLPVFSRA
jgi:hypothetical protein